MRINFEIKKESEDKYYEKCPSCDEESFFDWICMNNSCWYSLNWEFLYEYNDDIRKEQNEIKERVDNLINDIPKNNKNNIKTSINIIYKDLFSLKKMFLDTDAWKVTSLSWKIIPKLIRRNRYRKDWVDFSVIIVNYDFVSEFYDDTWRGGEKNSVIKIENLKIELSIKWRGRFFVDKFHFGVIREAVLKELKEYHNNNLAK